MTWTKVQNDLWDQKWFARLPRCEIVLLLYLLRLTNGWQQEWCYPGETHLLDATELSKSALKRAKKGLEDAGLIEANREGRVCGYRLSQLVPGGPAPEPVREQDGFNSGPGPKTDRVQN